MHAYGVRAWAATEAFVKDGRSYGPGTVVVQRELPIRKLFGNLRSAQFVLDTEAGANGRPGVWIFTGGGWGHGVGMCQLGAIGMSEHGHDYRQILSHYYGGAKTFKLYGARSEEPK